jgi:hypothetical protein
MSAPARLERGSRRPLPSTGLRSALERRFTRAEYARRAYYLFADAVRAWRAWSQGRARRRVADRAVHRYVAFVFAAGHPRRVAMRLRPGSVIR